MRFGFADLYYPWDHSSSSFSTEGFIDLLDLVAGQALNSQLGPVLETYDPSEHTFISCVQKTCSVSRVGSGAEVGDNEVVFSHLPPASGKSPSSLHV